LRLNLQGTMSPQDILQQPLEKMDIKSLAVDSERFGPLGFEKSLPVLETLREVFVDFAKFGYETRLPSNLTEFFRRDRERFTEYLIRLSNFDLRSDPDFRSKHDSFENEIQSFYQDFFQRYGFWITYFRQDTERKSADRKAVEKERELLMEARKQSEALLEELKKLKEEKERLQSTKGEVAAKKLAIHFKSEAEKYQSAARKWFFFIVIGYLGIIWAVICHTRFDNWAGISWQSAVSKGVFFAALWYGLSFLIRNYNINSHLAAVNRHRTAVANTLEDFLASGPSATGEMLQNGTQAMFKNVSIGFVGKAEKDSGNPILEIVNKVAGSSRN
jgi:hypothetical protein